MRLDQLSKVGTVVRALAAGASLAALLPAGIGAQQRHSSALTLSAAARQALESYPTIGVAGAQALAAEQAARGAAAARWPRLDLSGSATRYQEPMLVAPLHEFNPEQPPEFDETMLHGRVGGGYTLFDGRARGARIEAARERAAAASQVTSAAESSVLLTLTHQFALVTATLDALEAHDARLKALGEEVERSQRLLQAGRAAKLDVLRAEAALSAARTDRVRALTQLEMGTRELARLIGEPEPVDPARVARLRPSTGAPPPREVLIARAIEANPDVVRRQRERLAARAEVRLARSAFLPEVRLFGAYDQRTAGDGSGSGEWHVGAGVSFPLFDGGVRSREHQRAQAQAAATERQVAVTRLELEARIDRSLGALRDAEARLRELEQGVAHITEVVRGEQLALTAGAGIQGDYLRALADLVGARSQVAAAAMDRITSLTELAAATGELSIAWLEENLERQP